MSRSVISRNGGASRRRAALRRAPAAGRQSRAGQTRPAAQAARRSRAPRAHPPGRSRRHHAVAQLAGMAYVERSAGAETRGHDALLLVRSGDPGHRRRTGCGARPHSADRRADERRPVDRAVSQALRSPRGYFAVAAPHAAQRPEAAAFIQWLRSEATPRPAAAAPAGDQGGRKKPRAPNGGGRMRSPTP